ncbi:hypothetical protein C6I21_05590 [Alkalicoccus urumqiensis]|uniref:Uncharacterized protein n=2 Tax=Alkalicoccus urumqiensis TaxID=1548213 RepID=A0A2P6MJ05_ALKUR|nr:hypothetical protein C6I21_05590 [Alkalicoccus urumqiensis]
MFFDDVLRHGSPPLESIHRFRRYTELDLRRLASSGAVEKDYRGYYMFEVEKSAHKEPVRTERVYFEETFQWMEQEMRKRFDAAASVYTSIQGDPVQRRRVEKFKELMRLDYELLILLNIYSGRFGYPFYSVRQIRELIQDKLSLGIAAHALKRYEETPLNTMMRMDPILGRRYSPEELAGSTPGFKQKKPEEEVFLYTMPYGQNREKRPKK